MYGRETWPRGYKNFSMLNSAEHENSILGLSEPEKC